MKPLIVGEAPAEAGAKPLEKSALRLVTAMGYNVGGVGELSRAEAYDRLYSLFELRNLLDEPQPKQEGGKGAEWPEEEARAAAKKLALLVEREQSVVFLGKRVAAAFDVPVIEWWSWTKQWAGSSEDRRKDATKKGPWALLHYATIPHPSGVVRLWNQPETRTGAGMVLWQAVGKLPR